MTPAAPDRSAVRLRVVRPNKRPSSSLLKGIPLPPEQQRFGQFIRTQSFFFNGTVNVTALAPKGIHVVTINASNGASNAPMDGLI